MTDQALILRMARGDHAACRMLYDRWAPLIRGYVAPRLWWRPCDDDDVVQEVMLRVWHAAPHYVPADYDGRRWVWRIVRNLILDWARENQRHVRCYERLAATQCATDVLPSDDLEGEEAAVALWNRLEHSLRLTPKQRQCLRAALDHSGEPLVDVAAGLGMNVNTFKGHVWRARQAAQRVIRE